MALRWQATKCAKHVLGLWRPAQPDTDGRLREAACYSCLRFKSRLSNVALLRGPSPIVLDLFDHATKSDFAYIMDWKDTDFNFIFVEEINSDGGGVNKALQGLSVDDTVEALKRAIATELRTPQQWSSVTVFNAAQEMDKRELLCGLRM